MSTPPATSPPPAGNRRALVEAIIASTVGTTIEWYDFFLCGIAASFIFTTVFFPNLSKFWATFSAFSTFAIGFLTRPIGGIVFGYMGDRIGRKSTLVTTLLLLGVSTFLIGFLPGYRQIGFAAPVLLTLLRIIQGIGVGGEWGGAVLLALEYGHKGKRGFYASWPQAGVPLGLLAATGTLALVKQNMTAEAFDDWGWRVPFWLSGILIVVGLLIRLRILETPLFAELQKANQIAAAPVSEAIRRHWREILLAAGSRISENSCFYLFSAYVVTYGRDVLGLTADSLLQAVWIAAIVEFFTIPLFGMLSDIWSRKRTYMLGCVVMIAFAFPYYALLGTRAPSMVLTAVVVSLAGAHALLYAVQASLIPELFGTRLRYSGASIGYQLATPIAGGVAPLIAVTLVEWSHHYWPLAVYIILISVLSLVSVHLLAETSRKDLGRHD
jgi:metabolite-proton symporter